MVWHVQSQHKGSKGEVNLGCRGFKGRLCYQEKPVSVNQEGAGGGGSVGKGKAQAGPALHT